MNKRPTIVDVARHAGVSKSTVSLVLQNSPLVRTSTRDEVEKSMGALNYVYNRSAANLRGADVGLIGLVINDLRNPFFTEFAASAQMTFASRGYATVIANTDENPSIQTQVIASMIEHGVSGFLISPTYVDEDRGAREHPARRHPDDAGAAADRRPHRCFPVRLARLCDRRAARDPSI